jgi:hypothetical protein
MFNFLISFCCYGNAGDWTQGSTAELHPSPHFPLTDKTLQFDLRALWFLGKGFTTLSSSSSGLES